MVAAAGAEATPVAGVEDPPTAGVEDHPLVAAAGLEATPTADSDAAAFWWEFRAEFRGAGVERHVGLDAGPGQ